MQEARDKHRRPARKPPPPKKQAPKEQAPKQQAGPEHKRLDVFVGKWTLDGEATGSPFGPAAKVSGVQTYDWLSGGFFLVHRLEGRLGEVDMACLEIIGYDAETGSYPLRTFYHDGYSNESQAREREGTWTFTGNYELGDETYKIRCTTAFNEGRDAMTSKWEYAGDGSPWKPLWDTTATKA